MFFCEICVCATRHLTIYLLFILSVNFFVRSWNAVERAFNIGRQEQS